MDPTKFDAFAKRLAAGGVSRRGVLRGLGGALLAGLGGAGAAGADPACRGEGHPCEGNQDCCAGLVCAASGPGAALRCTAPIPTTTTTAAPTTTTTTSTTSTTTTSTTTSTTTPTTSTTTSTTTTPPPSCPAGSCPAGFNSCESLGCSATNPGCQCSQSVEGATVCVDVSHVSGTCGVQQCTSSANCGMGQSCIDSTKCCFQPTTYCAPCCTT